MGEASSNSALTLQDLSSRPVFLVAKGQKKTRGIK
jgi:hypothetical protein